MFCKNCGKEIDNDSAFCQYCGQKQSGSSASKKNTVSDKKDIKKMEFGIISYILMWIAVYIPFTIIFYLLLLTQD